MSMPSVAKDIPAVQVPQANRVAFAGLSLKSLRRSRRIPAGRRRSASWPCDDKAQSPLEVYEWSVWVGNPAQPAVNASRIYTNAMPTVVGTSRPKLEDKEAANVSALAGLGRAVFRRAEPRHRRRPEGRSKARSCRTGRRATSAGAGSSGSSRICPRPLPHNSAELPAGEPLVPEACATRSSALYLKYESHFERFIAYDSELTLAIPLKIRGGPDEYTLQNLTAHRLLDVAVIVPTADGFRVGWLDELPTATPEKKKEERCAEQEVRQGKGGRVLQGWREEKG